MTKYLNILKLKDNTPHRPAPKTLPRGEDIYNLRDSSILQFFEIDLAVL